MTNLLTALMTKLTASTLYTYVKGRIYIDQAPQDTGYPYVVFFIVASNPEDTFKSDIDDILIQLSLFSISQGASEISTMYGHLISVMDDISLTITGATLIHIMRENTTSIVEDISASQDGSQMVKHWAVDYSLKVEYS